MRSRWAREATLGTSWAPRKNQRHISTITGTDLSSMLGLCWTPKSIKLGIDFVIHFVMCVLSPLERLGVDCGAILVPKD